MRWKKSKPKPIFNTSGLSRFEIPNSILVVDIYGQVYFNTEITGSGKNMKIGNKYWEEIRDKVVAWEYMHEIEKDLLCKLVFKLVHIISNKKDIIGNVSTNFKLFNNKDENLLSKENSNSILGCLYIRENSQWHLAKMHILEEKASEFVRSKIINGKNCRFIADEFITINIKKYIIKYYNILSMKWRQTHFKDDYGRIIIKDWDQHLKYFLINIVSSENRKLGFVIMNILNEKAFGYNEKYKQRFLREIDKLYNEVAKEMEKQNNGMPVIKTGVDYENYVESLLLSGGFEVARTPITGDQGVDLVAEKKGIRVAIQCKYYSKPVGNKAVQEVIAGRDFYNCRIACVVSNNSFTPAARKIANVSSVLLLNDNQIVAKLDEIVG